MKFWKLYSLALYDYTKGCQEPSAVYSIFTWTVVETFTLLHCYIFTIFTGSSSLLVTKKMDLLDFFDMSKKFEKVMVPGSQTQGHVLTASEELSHDPFNIKKSVNGQDFAR